MDIASYMGSTEMRDVGRQVEAFNRTVGGAKNPSAGLDKDDFLKILLAQLAHQDPTQPLEDKEFVAQMAQFSTLEQMTNMSGELSDVYAIIARSQAISLLGRTVEIALGNGMTEGVVEEVTGGESPQVLVNGTYYDYLNVERVRK